MKAVNFFLPLLLSLTAAMKVVACDCNYNGSFMKVARNTDAVALVKIIKYKNTQKRQNQPIDLAMEARIIKVYKGKITEQILTIWGDDGIQCRPYVDEFTIGDKYIIALNSLSNEMIVNNSADYYVSICGAYWLKVNTETGMVYGDIDSSIRLGSANTLQGFEEKFRKEKI